MDYIVGNYNYKANSDCDKCNKKSVCKYKEEFNKYIKNIKNVDKGIINPFGVIIQCNEFIEDKNIR